MSEVVGVAILHRGRVLAARRSRPASLAGRWELPGGKAEPGEDLAGAAVREIAEELSCVVAVDSVLALVAPVNDELSLRVVLATLVSGEPVPHEHDAVWWLEPDELGRVDWLEPDRPFLPLVARALSGGRS